MKSYAINQKEQFVHFAQIKSKRIKKGFDGALLKLGVDNKWSTK